MRNALYISIRLTLFWKPFFFCCNTSQFDENKGIILFVAAVQETFFFGAIICNRLFSPLCYKNGFFFLRRKKKPIVFATLVANPFFFRQQHCRSATFRKHRRYIISTSSIEASLAICFDRRALLLHALHIN